VNFGDYEVIPEEDGTYTLVGPADDRQGGFVRTKATSVRIMLSQGHYLVTAWMNTKTVFERRVDT
jgi:hypothetical protein